MKSSLLLLITTAAFGLFTSCTSSTITADARGNGLDAGAVEKASLAFRRDQADKMIHSDPQGAKDYIYLKDYNRPGRPILPPHEAPDTWSFSGKSDDSHTWVWKKNGKTLNFDTNADGTFKNLGSVPGFIYHQAQGQMARRRGEMITFTWSPTDEEIAGAMPIAIRKG